MNEPIFIKCNELLSKVEQERFMYDIKKKMGDQPVILLSPFMDVVHPAQRWIPVTERLPEVRYFKPSDEDGFGDNPEGWYESDYVLFFAPEYYGNGYGIAQFVIEDNERFFTTEYSESLNCEQVLAWMPLPEPYTEVDNA